MLINPPVANYGNAVPQFFQGEVFPQRPCHLAQTYRHHGLYPVHHLLHKPVHHYTHGLFKASPKKREFALVIATQPGVPYQ